MNDKQLEALVNHIALEAGSGLSVGTLYGDMALAVAREVRAKCAAECRAMYEALREATPLDGSRAAVAQELERRILGA